MNKKLALLAAVIVLSGCSSTEPEYHNLLHEGMYFAEKEYPVQELPPVGIPKGGILISSIK